MSEEKEAFRLRERLSLPPGYDEAVASSSRSDVSDNEDESHEGQRLLFSADRAHDNAAAGSSSTTTAPVIQERQQPRTRPSGYRPPTVESARSSWDSQRSSSFLSSSSSSSNDSDRRSTESLRRILEVMDVEDPAQDGSSSRIRQRISKPFSILGGAISSLGSRVGSRFEWITSRLPRMPRIPSVISMGGDEDGVINFQRFIGAIIVVIIFYAIFATDIFTIRVNQGHQYDPDSVKRYLIDNIQPENIKHMVKYMSSFDHLAGTEGDYQIAQYVSGKLKEAGMRDIRSEEYEVLMNYPLADASGRRIAIVDPPNLKWEAQLEEVGFDTTKHPAGRVTPSFHAYSASGNVTGHLIYANFGSKQDFDLLKAKGVLVKGAVVLVRYFGTESDPSIKVKLAEDAGAAGIIMYSDPSDNGMSRGKTWPEGKWMASDYVQRASVGLTRYQPGDPLSPGLPSNFHSTRIDRKDAVMVKIPSLPLAWKEAAKLLQAIKGHGIQPGNDWKGAVPSVDWWTGDANSPKVNLMNMHVEHQKQKIWNVLCSIEGYEQPRKAIVIGSRRDSWAYGATSSMTGTAMMLELARVMGSMFEIGWRPARTIHFASWDGGHYNLVGSTEWVEQYASELRMDGIVYINVGAAVTGPDFFAKGSPALERPLKTALGWLLDPVTNKTLRELWGDKKIESPAIDTDSVAFTNFAGMATMDIGFTTPDGDKGYPLHSAYDSYEWMLKFGDPKWQYVPLLTQIWGILTIIMSDSLVVQLNYVDYAIALDKKIDELKKWVDGKRGKERADSKMDWKPMKDTIKALRDHAADFNQFEVDYDNLMLDTGGQESSSTMVDRLEHNSKLGLFETHMLDMGAVPGREWFKNTIFAPQARSELDHLWFPAIVDAVEAGDWGQARFHLERIRQVLDMATRSM